MAVAPKEPLPGLIIRLLPCFNQGSRIRYAMFSNFKYERLRLSSITLDDRNPRIVTQAPLTSQDAIVKYLFEHEGLGDFIKKIMAEGKNIGAERPYVVQSGRGYVVVEGNTRIAAYKVLSGLVAAPQEYKSRIPKMSAELKSSLRFVDCSVAPDRDALLSIMASAHFGTGDKSKWGYLGSRKAVYDEKAHGKSLDDIASAFDKARSEIIDLILEYEIYLQALALKWSDEEKAALLSPSVQFNPPIRFLQTKGHKAKVGISYDKVRLKVVFADAAAKKKFQHLIRKLVVSPQAGLGATASYENVFVDFVTTTASPDDDQEVNDGGGHSNDGPARGGSDGTSGGGSADGGSWGSDEASASGDDGSAGGEEGGGAGASGDAANTPPAAKPASGALFAYEPKISNALVRQLMTEARTLNCKKYPAAGTFLLRNIVEAVLKHIIHENDANAEGNSLDLERSLNLSMSQKVKLSIDDKKILKEFSKSHLSYLNLGAHGTVIPNYESAKSARDCIDQFIKRNI